MASRRPRETRPARSLERRKDRLRDFASVFRGVAYSRELVSTPRLADFHLRQAVSRADEGLVEQIAQAQAPFWRHVRDALAKRHPAAGGDDKSSDAAPADPCV